MRRDSLEVLKRVFVLVMLMPAVALANFHWGYVYWDEQEQDYLPFDVDVSDREVAPGDYITVEFGYTVLVSDGAPTSLWAIVFDGENGQVPYDKPPSVLLAEGHPSTQPNGTYTFDFTGENEIVVQIPGTATPGQYPINIFSCAASYRPVADFAWYGEPPQYFPIMITVKQPDTTPPVITCPGDITIEAMGPEGVPVDDLQIQTFLNGASATDNVDPPEDIVIANDAPDLFPPGDTVVTFTATDMSNNSSICESTVTVTVTETGPVEAIEEIIADIEDMDVPEAEKELNKAVKELNKAIKEFNKGKPDKAIKKIEQAIKQLEKAGKKGADTQAVIDELLGLIEGL